ncbi:uncharacterized protein EDB93DRAFT_1252676 [Suillus bovinus]|uniref:uncharacterized protein n=1 Tax=Suillus bovinus TaxID=48563 RepID=UPI001B877C0D|nr:uncharacterized protein EDB93DRAFT_1252676 [Suillus bovinus]KAG2140891.1 hypothetical protein EDB93DRAFT_1252676 [Suillus bovinus]
MMMPLEREDWIQVALADAVQECLERVHIQALRSNSAKSVKDELKDFSRQWAAKNAGSLDTQLSVPFDLIMETADEVASIVIDRGYDLCPSLWSNILEVKSRQGKIGALINDAMWPLKFIYKKDETTGQWMVFEHNAILDMVLGIVWKLKYLLNVTDLDNLYCTAVAAVYCVLLRLSSGKLNRTILFTSKAFRFMYDISMKHITDVIEKDSVLGKRCLDYYHLLLQEHLDAWAPTIFLLILLVSALASYPYPDLALVILVILAFPFALYLSLQQSQYIWPDPFADEAYPCSVSPPD